MRLLSRLLGVAPPEPGARSPRRWAAWLKAALLVALVVAAVSVRLLRPVSVRAHTVDRGPVVREVFGRGTLESRREVQLGFDLVGRVADLLVDEGDRVKLGQVLGHLAPEQFSADVRTATSAVSAARAAIARLAADEKRAAATLVFAEAEALRNRTLATRGVVSTRDLDLVEQQLALARAEVERVRASREEAQRMIAVASGTADARSATAGRAVLVSPFDGVVVRRSRDPGDTVTVGTTVLRVVATDTLWSRAWIDESALPSLGEGQPVRVRLAASGPATAAGKVDRIGREVDRQTHELLVDVVLDRAPARAAMGQRADVWIEVERRPDAVRVPVGFVAREGARAWCFVGRDGRIRRVPVELGLAGGDLVEVSSGLAVGDVVLASNEPAERLPEGRRFQAAAP